MGLFAVNSEHKRHDAIKEAKELVSDAIRLFQQRGVIAHIEYAADVPAALHGGPRTEQVICFFLIHTIPPVHALFSLRVPSSDTCCIWLALAASQESKDILERLRRMDNFENQDYDEVVLPCPACWVSCLITRCASSRGDLIPYRTTTWSGRRS